MGTTDAWIIPEILIQIGAFLAQSDLIQCACVCSSWNAVFHPLVWKSVSLGGAEWVPNQVLIQQATHIRSFRLHNKITSDKCGYARNYLRNQLNSFSVEWVLEGKSWSNDVSVLWSDIALVVANNYSTLRSLTLKAQYGIPLKDIRCILSPGSVVDGQSQRVEDEIDRLSSDAERCLRISNMTRPGFANLRRLMLEDILVPTIQVLESIVLICQQLESLKLSRVTIPYRRMGFGVRDSRLPAASILSQLLEPEEPTDVRRSQLNQDRQQQGRFSPNQRIEHRSLRVLDLDRVLACDSRALWAWFVAPSTNLRQLRWLIAQDQGFPAYAACGNSRGCRRIEGRVQKNQNWIMRGPVEELAISGKTTFIEDASLNWMLMQGFVDAIDRSATSKPELINQSKGHEWPSHSQQQPGCRTKLKTLSVPRSGFGPLAFDAFWKAGHDHTISELNLLRCKHVSSTMILDLLAGCPSLEVFSADEVLGEDVLKDERPWVCTRLRQLNVFFNANLPTDPPIHHLLCIFTGSLLRNNELMDSTMGDFHEVSDSGDTEKDRTGDNCSIDYQYQQIADILAIREAVFNRLVLLTELKSVNTWDFITPMSIGLWISPTEVKRVRDIEVAARLSGKLLYAKSSEDPCRLVTLKHLLQNLPQQKYSMQDINVSHNRRLPVVSTVIKWREQSLLKSVERVLLSLMNLAKERRP